MYAWQFPAPCIHQRTAPLSCSLSYLPNPLPYPPFRYIQYLFSGYPFCSKFSFRWNYFQCLPLILIFVRNEPQKQDNKRANTQARNIPFLFDTAVKFRETRDREGNIKNEHKEEGVRIVLAEELHVSCAHPNGKILFCHFGNEDTSKELKMI